MKKGNKRVLMRTLAVLLSYMAMIVQARDWVAPAGTTNDWNIVNNWQGGVVPSNEVANISNGGTAHIRSGDMIDHTPDIWVGNGTSGNQLLQTGGTLIANHWFVIGRGGTGVTNLYTQTGGTFIKTGVEAIQLPNEWGSDNTATWTMSGSAVAEVYRPFVIGQHASVGTLNVLDGASYSQSGHELKVQRGAINNFDGTMNMSNVPLNIMNATLNNLGGTMNLSNCWVAVGRWDNAVGSMVISNGFLNRRGYDFNVGWDGDLRNAKGTVTLAGTSVVKWASSTLNVGGTTNDNTFTIKDDVSLMMTNSEIDVGRGGWWADDVTWIQNTGTMNIMGGSLYCPWFFGIGRDGAKGVVNLSGGTLTKGDNGDRFSIANQGIRNNGTLNQTGGRLVVNANIEMASHDSVATYHFSGGMASSRDIYMGLGYNTLATLNMSGNASLTANNVHLGHHSNAVARLTISDNASLTANNVLLGWTGAYTSGVVNSTINLDGGTLAVYGIYRGNNLDAVQLNLNGGLLKGRLNNANFLSNIPSSMINVLMGGAFFDGGGCAITVNNDLSGEGGLTMQGSGILTLNGANSYLDGTTVNGGVLIFGSTGALPVTNRVTVNAGGAVGTTFSTVQDLLSSTQMVFNGGGVALTAANATEDVDLSDPLHTTVFIASGEDVTYSGTLTPNGDTYRLGGGGTLTYTPAITGNANLIVSGGTGSKVILTAENTYNGGTLINPGATLQGSVATLPSIGGIIANGTLLFDQATDATYGNAINGSGSVVKQNSGTLTLSGANSYTGSTTVNLGGLLVGADTTLGSPPIAPTPASLGLNNPWYDYNGGYHNHMSYTTAGAWLGMTGSFTLDANRGIMIGNTRGELYIASGHIVTYNGLMTHTEGAAGGLLVRGPGTLLFGGQCQTPGGLQIDNGTVRLERTDILGGNPLAVGAGLASTLDLNGYSQLVGALSGDTVGVIINSTARAVTLTVGAGNATSAFGAAIQEGIGPITLTKIGTGILNLNSLSGANVYSGDTTISAGTLRLIGATEQWTADSLMVEDGEPVTLWRGLLGGSPAEAWKTAPTLAVNALNGHNVVNFNGVDQNLRVQADNSPMAGASDYTLAIVFRPYAVGQGGDGGDWYNRTGLLDSEQGGVVNDWGFGWNANQKVSAGLGGGGDRVVYSAPAALESAHVALYSKTSTRMTLLVDGETFHQTAAGTAVRNKNMFAIGSGSGNNLFLNGDIAEIRIYRTALLGPSLTNVWQSLAHTYGMADSFIPQETDLIPNASVVNVASNAVFDLNDQNETVAGLSGAVGASVTLGVGTLTLGGATGPQGFEGVISGAGGLVKTGDYVQTLSGENTYSGVTMVNDGTLLADGSLASAVTVGTDAAFGVAGTAGTLVVGNGLMLNGELVVDVTTEGASDLVNVAGDLMLGPNATLRVVDTDQLDLINKAYPIATYTGMLTGKFQSDNLPGGWVVRQDTQTKTLFIGPPSGTIIQFF